MEEDAGANRLTPPRAADSPAVAAVSDPAGPKTGADMPDTEATTQACEPNAEHPCAAVTVASAVTDAEDAGAQVGMADRENSYRLRVKMVPEDGQFKIAELDQVTK